MKHKEPRLCAISKLNASSKSTIKPNAALLYNWNRPERERSLKVAVIGQTDQEMVLLNEEEDTFWTNSNGKIIHWTSFLHDKQRVLLFADNNEFVDLICSNLGILRRPLFELSLTFDLIGISMINDHLKTEIAYLTILPIVTGSYRKQGKKKWKKCIGNKREYLKGLPPLSGNYEFENHKGEMVQIESEYKPGFWSKFTFSKRNVKVHLRAENLQVDNCLKQSHFAVALVPMSRLTLTPPEKPFIESTMEVSKQRNSRGLVFKKWKVLVQEMSVKVDYPFLAQLYAFFTSQNNQFDQTTMAMFQEDLKAFIGTEGGSLSSIVDHLGFFGGDTKHLFENINISPLKIQLSFSPLMDENDDLVQIISPGQLKAMQIIGVFSGNVQEASLRLTSYKKPPTFMSWNQFFIELYQHYYQQMSKQFHQFVLGSDFLAIFGGDLARALLDHVENLYYEPSYATMDDTDDIDGTFKKAISDVSGGFGKYLRNAGNYISKLTFDEDYKRSRRVANRMPRWNVLKGFRRWGFSFKGAFEGVILKPKIGHAENGVPGFFQGLAKGAVGVAVKPVVGLFDFAGNGLNALGRMMYQVEELRPARPPRFIEYDGAIRPYVFAESQIIYILSFVAEGRLRKESYVGHLLLEQFSKEIFQLIIATDEGIHLMEVSKDFDSWFVTQSYNWREIKKAPSFTGSSIKLTLSNGTFKEIRCDGATEFAKVRSTQSTITLF